jgi:S1-C subfamily serine protease
MQDDTSVYILTCAHVIMPEDGASITGILVADYKYNTYFADKVAIDDSYDLAVIKIKRLNPGDMPPIPMAQKEVRTGDAVAAVSSPDGQINALTVGNVTDISTPQNASGDAINLGFDVICHNTWLTNGSSGSVLFNSEGKIVGINYAVTRTPDGEHIESYAVPVGKIMEFLKKYSLN